MIALNKTDLLLPDSLKDVSKAIKALNPKAKVIPCTFGEVLCSSVSCNSSCTCDVSCTAAECPFKRTCQVFQ